MQGHEANLFAINPTRNPGAFQNWDITHIIVAKQRVRLAKPVPRGNGGFGARGRHLRETSEMARFTAVVLSAFMISGCVNFEEAMERRRLMAELTPAGQGVSIVEKASSSCTQTATVDTRLVFPGYDEEQNIVYLQNYLRNFAAENGANAVVLTKEDWYKLTGDPAASHVGVEIEATTYNCG